jgi:hypothetical protein
VRYLNSALSLYTIGGHASARVSLMLLAVSAVSTLGDFVTHSHAVSQTSRDNRAGVLEVRRTDGDWTGIECK